MHYGMVQAGCAESKRWVVAIKTSADAYLLLKASHAGRLNNNKASFYEVWTAQTAIVLRIV